MTGGHTYGVDGITWFDVSTAPKFGRLSGYAENTMLALSAESGGTPTDLRQRNPLDFILWQPSADDEPSWESPFGPGRPGWHIECSAMCWAHFGQTIDLHGGGSDLIFPHHECERVGLCRQVHVMFAGLVVESLPAVSPFAPRHPYTRELVRALPRTLREDPGLWVQETFFSVRFTDHQ